MLNRCPACDAPAADPFFSVTGLPVHGTAVLPDPASARSVSVGDQVLVLCERCGTVFNRDFDAGLLDYTGDHEESQHHSPRFAAYAAEITADWVSRFGLAGEHVVEVGCGSGDFAAELLGAGVGRVTGIDPHFAPARVRAELAGRLTALPAEFARDQVEPGTAALVCRHTLEHIPALAAFGAELRAGLVRGGGRALLAEVPDLGRILDEGAFWDLQYEHCSYFTPATMRTFLTGAGFSDPAVRLTYADQYVVAEAGPDGTPGTPELEPHLREALHDACHAFATRVREQVGRWRVWLGERAAAGDEVVVWGGGAKGLTFLNVVEGESGLSGVDGPAPGAVQAVVDINPGLQGHYMGGLGLPIRAPKDLLDAPPRSVLLMNPVYIGEVRSTLDELGLGATELLAV
ncbi:MULTISPECIES: class I SAM-dependent methyltransferase [unclassified Pseudonocardia]|uniref:class I SAM-dependent methyltransferase n=1 Tax=unclassified Pseudonocardia TaxID=2619320 RepID=UPI0001FFF0E7|nr:class I SAM-dependent methyltransferase [Pseudonocardia sp. Ae707_Ps1]OLM21410.1 putative NDP-hexose methyltransferase protein [Pseudonocardia sp. Ae707_Ps1]